MGKAWIKSDREITIPPTGNIRKNLLVDSLIRPKILVGRLILLELCTVREKKSLVLAFIALEYLEQF